jgi:hypothetical protein
MGFGGKKKRTTKKTSTPQTKETTKKKPTGQTKEPSSRKTRSHRSPSATSPPPLSPPAPRNSGGKSTADLCPKKRRAPKDNFKTVTIYSAVAKKKKAEEKRKAAQNPGLAAVTGKNTRGGKKYTAGQSQKPPKLKAGSKWIVRITVRHITNIF